jgi:hypothetical protein
VRGGEIVVVAASGGELNSGVGEDIFDDPIAASHLPSLIDSHVTKLTDSSDLRSVDPLSLYTLNLNH